MFFEYKYCIALSDYILAHFENVVNTKISSRKQNSYRDFSIPTPMIA